MMPSGDVYLLMLSAFLLVPRPTTVKGTASREERWRGIEGIVFDCRGKSE